MHNPQVVEACVRFPLLQQPEHLLKISSTKLAVFPFLIDQVIDLNFHFPALVSVNDCDSDLPRCRVMFQLPVVKCSLVLV